MNMCLKPILQTHATVFLSLKMALEDKGTVNNVSIVTRMVLTFVNFTLSSTLLAVQTRVYDIPCFVAGLFSV